MYLDAKNYIKYIQFFNLPIHMNNSSSNLFETFSKTTSPPGFLIKNLNQIKTRIRDALLLEIRRKITRSNILDGRIEFNSISEKYKFTDADRNVMNSSYINDILRSVERNLYILTLF